MIRCVQRRKRARRRRMAETALCWVFMALTYVAMAYAIVMDAFFGAPTQWTITIIALALTLQLVTMRLFEALENERRKKQ